MSDENVQSDWARRRTAGKARRASVIERRETYFDLLLSGYSVPQIAKAMGVDASGVRRAISRALDERRLDAPEDFARLQVARLMKALRNADHALEDGDREALPQFVSIVKALDRYHGFAEPLPLGGPRRRPTVPRLAPPPLALTHVDQAAVCPGDEGAEDCEGVADDAPSSQGAEPSGDPGEGEALQASPDRFDAPAIATTESCANEVVTL